MRFEIKVYETKYRQFLKELFKNEKNFVVPSEAYMKDLALFIWDKKDKEMVAFVCIVAGLSDTVYASHFILSEKLRKTTMGGHVIKKLSDYLDKALKRMRKKACEFFVDDNNKELIRGYMKRGSRIIAKGYLLRREL